MKTRARVLTVSVVILLAAFVLSSCGEGSSSGSSSGEKRTTRTEFLSPSASGSTVWSNGDVSVDASNISEGYIMVKYSGSANKIKIQLTGPDGNTYTYTSYTGDYQTFPITAGSGDYKIDVLEQVQGTMYFLALSQNFSVSITDEFSPFLYPNQYVWYTASSKAVEKGKELSDKSSNDLSYVENVYSYVIKNVKYDEDKAANIAVDYIPTIDETLETKKGICFDYASLMSAMLRSQGVPTKLVIGYSGSAYHAWISVYLSETGWVDNIIEFDGTEWSLMDPTLASNNSSSSVEKYIGDGNNYMPKFYH